MAAVNAVIKIACLVLYALGIARVAGLLPASWNTVATVAAAVLVAHVFELVLMFRHVRRYQGSLAVSVLLTLLFGYLHWKPLADKDERGVA